MSPMKWPKRLLLRSMARSIAVMMVGIAATSPSVSQAESLREDPRVRDAINLLDRWMDAQQEYEQIPGISVAVVHDQELVWSAGFGYSDLESQRPAGPKTIYSICSISKLFTSVAAMKLRDEGKIRLDDRVDALLPWFNLKSAHPKGPAVTLKGLLTHSAGIPTDAKAPPGAIPYLYSPTRDEVVVQIAELETVYPAWEHYHYSNLGLILVGQIVAEVSGQPYGEYVREKILSPLEMFSTTPDIGEVQATDRLATGYSATRRGGGRERVEPFQVHAGAPARGFASTVEDLARFASWQFRLLETGEHEILNANTLREMQRVNYMDPDSETTSGLGFDVFRRNDKIFVGHSGDCPGYRSSLLIQLEDKIATIGMANTVAPVWSYAGQAYDIVTPAIRAAKEVPDGGKRIPLEFEKYVGAYNGFPFGGEFQVVPWGGSIAVVRFPRENLLAGLRRLEHIEGEAFRHVRGDDLSAEEYVFEMDAEGLVVRMLIGDYALPRMP